MAKITQGRLRATMVVFIALLSLLAGHSPTRVEYALLDLRFSINRALGGVADASYEPKVATLLVTPESERRLGDVYSAQWRRFYPSLVRTLAASGARAIVWDATFVASVPDHDAALAEAFGIIPVIAAENAVEHNNEVIRPALAGIGWKQFVIVGNLPRRTLAGTSLPPLGSVAGARLGVGPGHPDGIWLDFSRDPLAVPRLDIADVILAEGERLADEDRTPASVFTDRIVFIGTDLPGADRYPIPGTRGRAVAGVLAQVVSMWTHLSPRPIHRVDGWIARAAVALPAVAIAFAGSGRQRRVRRLGTGAVVAIVLLAPPAAFALWRLWLPWAATIVFAGLAIGLIALEHRFELARNYRTSLGFDPRLLERHASGVESYASGVERTATVLCADVRNYTQFVTDSLPDEVQKVMTGYMAAMESIVHANGGYINKFVGDEIIAVFGFPLEEADAEVRAVRTAGEMLDRLRELNAEWSVGNLPVLDGIGIGIDTGPLRFTNIGGERRVQFDVIGGAVNGASRLQALTKQMERSLIVSADVATRQDVFPVAESGTSTEGAECFEFIGEVLVRGQGRRRLFGMATVPARAV